MITRRRYSIPIRKASQESARGLDVHVGRSPAKEAPLRTMVRTPEENWWTDWRSTTAVVALILAIGASLYLVKGKDLSYDASPSQRVTASASSSSSAPSPLSSPRRNATARAGSSSQSGGGTYSGGSAPPAGDADSFLTFSRAAKAAHSGSPAPYMPTGTSPSSPAGGRSVLSHGEQKVVLPDKLSGECRVGGASIGDFLKGLGDCFAQRAARGV